MLIAGQSWFQNFVWQPVKKENMNSDMLKLALHDLIRFTCLKSQLTLVTSAYLKIDIVSAPARAEGGMYIYSVASIKIRMMLRKGLNGK